MSRVQGNKLKAMREQRETVGGNELIHILLPEAHARLLPAFGPQLGGFQKDDHQAVQGVDLVFGQVILGDRLLLV